MKLNVPNALTLFRILLIPVYLWRYLTAQSQMDYLTAAGILLLSALSDTMDGYIARRFHQITQLGKILDPAADKLTLAAVIVSLWLTRPNWWPLYTLFILKEFLMLLGGLRLHRKQVKIEGAKWFGKLSTIMFYVIMTGSYTHLVEAQRSGPGNVFLSKLNGRYRCGEPDHK